jgi:hypothetical protein
MWKVVDHACSLCSGRLLATRKPDGREIVRCAECGTERTGDHQALCWCGTDTGFRCARNPAQTAEVSTEIIIIPILNV